MPKFDDYSTSYRFIKMERRDGILQMTLHSKGGELLWGGKPHEECSYAFYDVARDRVSDGDDSVGRAHDASLEPGVERLERPNRTLPSDGFDRPAVT